MVKAIPLSIGIVIIILLYLNLKKDHFKTVQQEKEIDYDNTYRPHGYTNSLKKTDNSGITKSFLTNLISDYSNHFNANGGANVSVYQNKYDLLFKDIIIGSDKRNKTVYPNPNEYSMKLNLNLDRIYKAELIDVYIPAATDDAVNIPTFANRLYFSYTNTKCCITTSTVGYIIIFAGTYSSPETVACEITRQFNIVLPLAGFKCGAGVICSYDKNLNRYVFSDMDYDSSGTFIIYPENGYIIDESTIVVNSITEYLMLLGNSNFISGPKYINSIDNVLFVDTAQPGDYGEYSDTFVPLTKDPQFSNCIISDVVLTNCKLFLSLGKLNGNTCNVVPDQSNGQGNVPCMFCQIPNNTTVSSHSVKTLLNQPSVYSSIQFYNPPISKLNKMEIKWYTDTGNLVRILDHCFTIRVYYFQKRLDTTDFSFPIP
jgi:hypothetical protein